MKICATCGAQLTTKQRTYCSIACGNRARRKPASELSKQGARTRARRAHGKPKRCAECGSRRMVQLHHPDIERHPELVVPLCIDCHTAADMELGKHSASHSRPLVVHVIGGKGDIDVAELRKQHPDDYLRVLAALVCKHIEQRKPVTVASDGAEDVVGLLEGLGALPVER